MTPTHTAFLDAIRADGARPGGARPVVADWRGLSARLAAAHALRRLLHSAEAAPAARAASFAPAVARGLAGGAFGLPGGGGGGHPCSDVNPFASTDGKPDGGKVVARAGIQSPAIEG